MEERYSRKFIEKFQEFINEHNLLEKKSKVIVGFSGGPDSTALLLALLKIKDMLDLSILVAHVNYNLRGEDSKRDEDFVKQFCFQHNLYLVMKNVKLESKVSMEQKARDIRMEFFHSLKDEYNMEYIALGHNKGDVAETVIMNLARGSGISGLRGILPKTDTLIHPFIIFSKQDIYRFLEEENCQWCEDYTNKESSYTRNKVRNDFLPWLEENVNSNVEDKLIFVADLMKDTEEFIEDYVTKRFKKFLLKSTETRIELDLHKIRISNSVIRYYFYKRCITMLVNVQHDIYQNNINEIESVLFTNGSKVVYLPHKVYVIKQYEKLIFTTKNPLLQHNEENDDSRVLTSIRSRLTVGNYRINMKRIKKIPADKTLVGKSNVVYLDYNKITLPLKIRFRQPGDRFMPLGVSGFKKLKDFFIDEKVPRYERDKILIFEDDEKIIWVGGMRIDNRVAIDKATTTNILRIEIEELSENKLRSAERMVKE